MRIKRLIAAGAVALALISVPQSPMASAVVAPPTPTTAHIAGITASASKKLTASQKKKLRATWKKYGVKKSVQDKLIKKLDQHKRWNSITKGAKAKKKKVYNRGGFKVTVRTFADGSIHATEAQIPKKPADTNSVPFGIAATTGCTITTGSAVWRATYCLVADTYVAFGIYMRVDYRVRITGDLTGAIESVYEVGGFSILGGFDDKDPVRHGDDEFHITYKTNLFPGMTTATSVCRIKANGAGPLSVSSKAV